MFDPSQFSLNGAIALVTGAGAGIGQAVAETFAGAGAAVAVTDLDEAAAKSIARKIVADGGQAFGAGCNVTQEANLAAIVDRTVSELGGLTILVNNAGGGGAILNVTSMAAENHNQRMASYASSKAAESHLTRNIAHDLGSMNIRVNAIAPGATKTTALQKVLTPEMEKAMLARTPLMSFRQKSVAKTEHTQKACRTELVTFG